MSPPTPILLHAPRSLSLTGPCTLPGSRTLPDPLHPPWSLPRTILMPIPGPCHAVSSHSKALAFVPLPGSCPQSPPYSCPLPGPCSCQAIITSQSPVSSILFPPWSPSRILPSAMIMSPRLLSHRRLLHPPSLMSPRTPVPPSPLSSCPLTLPDSCPLSGSCIPSYAEMGYDQIRWDENNLVKEWGEFLLKNGVLAIYHQVQRVDTIL